MEIMFLKGILIFFMCLNIQYIEAQFKDISRVIARIQNGYRKDVLPTRTSGSYVAVKVYPAIVRIDDLDAQREELSSTISLSLYWTDERLAWDPRDYGGVTEVRVPASSIWLPDITVYNTISPPEEVRDQLVEVSSLGRVLFIRNVHARSYCHVDLTWFPRDQHTCELIFSSWIYPSQRVMMEFMHVNTSSTDVPVLADTDPKIINLDGHKWQLRGRKARAEINLLTYSCCLEESYVQLKIALTVKRNSSLLTDMFIIPMLVISVLVPFQFLLASRTSQRPLFGLLLVFGECLSLVLLCLYIPTYSNFPFIGIINLCCLISATCALIFSTITTNIGNIKRRPLPPCLQNFIAKVSLISKKKGHDYKTEKHFTKNNLSATENRSLIRENHFELEDMAPSEERRRLTNEPNGVVNRNASGPDNVSENSDNTTIRPYLQELLCEFKQIHSVIRNLLEQKENLDWFYFATFLDKAFFLLFLLVFLIEISVLCLSM